MLSLLRTTEVAQLSDLANSALDTLDSLTTQLLAALRLQADPEMAGDGTPAEAAPAAAGPPPSRPLPPVLPSAAAAGAGGGGGTAAGRWEVWQLADAVWASATPLLRRLDAVPRVCPLLTRLLPLLYQPPPQPAAAPVDPDAESEATAAAAALWRGYLEALCAVLRFPRLVPAAHAAAAAAAAAAAPTAAGAGGGRKQLFAGGDDRARCWSTARPWCVAVPV